MPFRAVFLTLLLACNIGKLFPQELRNDSAYINNQKLKLLSGSLIVTQASLVYSLNNLWYKDYPKSSFHLFNDNREWLQVDKVGHLFSSYYGGVIGTELLKSCGLDHKKSTLIGGNLGWIFLGSIEILDGYSKNWGFSWGDICANTMGSLIYIGQNLTFKEQKLMLKFSYSKSLFAAYRPNVLGKNIQQSLIKDYNAQTYWFTFNINQLGFKSIPKWFCLSLGYGAEGMIGAEQNPKNDSFGNPIPNFQRRRQYYLSLDMDLTALQVKNQLLRFMFSTIRFIKIPAPSIEWNKDRIIFHPVYF